MFYLNTCSQWYYGTTILLDENKEYKKRYLMCSLLTVSLLET